MSVLMKQIYPASITGKGFAAGGSVLDHKFGDSPPFTLGVEEEYMLLDPQSFDLVQHVDTVLTAVENGELPLRAVISLRAAVLIPARNALSGRIQVLAVFWPGAH